jgi:hypothetical protein
MRPTALRSASHHLASAIFMSPKSPIQPSVEVAAPLTTGRILQSLVEPPAASDPIARTLRPRPGRPRSVKGSQSTPTLEVPCDPAARSGNVAPVEPARCIVPPIDGIAVSAGEATPASNQVVQDSSVPAPRPKTKRRAQIPITVDAVPASASVNDRASAPRPMTIEELSCPERKRTIMGRYVIGNELKPGERWKRRLFKGR